MLDCPKDDDSRKPLVAKLEEWTKRYNDVITIAESTPGASKQEQAGQKTGRIYWRRAGRRATSSNRS